ncbi:MAG: hypothetical protein J7K88_11435 [Candidatus Fermentibacteraceae bacterium]|nr:hypothetical protein [Candidatus Fermentibacteraceae bacterium]
MTAVLLFVVCFSPLDLELAGKLPEAGAAWEEEGSLSGQIRVMGRLVEEAIYAGDGRRAFLLASELENICHDSDLQQFWMARIAWTSGLPVLAAEQLKQMNPSDPWLLHRARGLSALFSENSGIAIQELTMSIAEASTARKAFWSGIDLCSAYLEAGRFSDALQLSRLIRVRYPGDAMGEVMYGLCLQVSGQFGESSRVLSSVDTGNPAAVSLARSIMEGFEQ